MRYTTMYMVYTGIYRYELSSHKSKMSMQFFQFWRQITMSCHGTSMHECSNIGKLPWNVMNHCVYIQLCAWYIATCTTSKMYIHWYACIYMHVFVYTKACMYIHAYLCIYVYIHTCISMYVHGRYHIPCTYVYHDVPFSILGQGLSTWSWARVVGVLKY